MTPAVGESRTFVYKVGTFHFHGGNEHRVAGNPTFEMHIKTLDQFGSAAVFATLWTPDAAAPDDPTLTAAYRSLSSPPGDMAAVAVSPVLWNFGRQPFYSYVGSLTTPPCTKGIRWYVLQAPVRTSPASIDRLRDLLVSSGMPRNNVRSPRPLAQPQPAIHLVTPR